MDRLKNIDKPKCGMYGGTPTIIVGRFTISEFTEPAGDYLWIEDTKDGDAMSVGKDKLEAILEPFYKKNF